MNHIRRFAHFDGTRNSPRPMVRVGQVREAARDFRREMLAGPKVLFYRSFELVRVPYPSKYGYLNAYAGVSPFVHLCNRLFVIQFQTNEGVKTLLVGPSDWEHQRETPFFARLNASAGPFSSSMEDLIFKKTSTVLERLAEIGLAPTDIDYITYDHLHTQNVRRWLGADGAPAIFPNAKLLVFRAEWESTLSLIPWQSQWYCPHGIDGIAPQKLILLDHDVLLGDGIALMRTTGHTIGNHSIVAHTDDGLFVTSENGIALDAYAPQHSKLPGIAEYAKVTGSEVILNGNTLEYGVDQYISMIQEKEVAGPSKVDPRIPNLAPSSESYGYWLFPRTEPTFHRGDLHFGELRATSTTKPNGATSRRDAAE